MNDSNHAAAREESKREAPDTEIEVTPEMIEAGVNALLDAEDRSYPDFLAGREAEEAVRQIFFDMRNVERAQNLHDDES